MNVDEKHVLQTSHGNRGKRCEKQKQKMAVTKKEKEIWKQRIPMFSHVTPHQTGTEEEETVWTVSLCGLVSLGFFRRGFPTLQTLWIRESCSSPSCYWCTCSLMSNDMGSIKISDKPVKCPKFFSTCLVWELWVSQLIRFTGEPMRRVKRNLPDEPCE